MKIVRTISAKARPWRDRHLYLARSPSGAKRVRERAEGTVRYLQYQPFMGRTGESPGTREAFAPPSYRIVYQVTGETVSILRVLHKSRQWPPAADEGDT